MKQEFRQGLTEGYQATSGVNLNAQQAAPAPQPPAPTKFTPFQASITPAWSFAPIYTPPAQHLCINGRVLGEIDTLKLKIAGYQPPRTDYW
jgi:hypothetical protein